jgi:hypothetical protein
MKNDFSVECWLFNQSITARIVINDLQIYQEYHPVITSGISPVDLKNYHFISGYDGTLELNQPPGNEFTAILLKELADAIELKIRAGQQAPHLSRQPYASPLTSGSPSAAA